MSHGLGGRRNRGQLDSLSLASRNALQDCKIPNRDLLAFRLCESCTWPDDHIGASRIASRLIPRSWVDQNASRPCVTRKPSRLLLRPLRRLLAALPHPKRPAVAVLVGAVVLVASRLAASRTLCRLTLRRCQLPSPQSPLRGLSYLYLALGCVVLGR